MKRVLNKYSLLELCILRLSFLLDSKYPPHMAPDIHQQWLTYTVQYTKVSGVHVYFSSMEPGRLQQADQGGVCGGSVWHKFRGKFQSRWQQATFSNAQPSRACQQSTHSRGHLPCEPISRRFANLSHILEHVYNTRTLSLTSRLPPCFPADCEFERGSSLRHTSC